VTAEVRTAPSGAVVASIGIGGVAGAAARYGVALVIGGPVWPTLAVNLAGSFLLGVVVAAVARRRDPHPAVRPLLATGFLGAFTTYSAFALDTVVLLQEQRLWAAAGYVAGSIGGGVAAVWAGLATVRALLPAGRG
jgi:CrcB protein